MVLRRHRRIGIEGRHHLRRRLGQVVRIDRRRLLDQLLLHPVAVLGFKFAELIDRAPDYRRMFGRDLTGRLRRRDVGEQRRQFLAADASPRTQISRRPHPRLRLARREMQLADEQRIGRRNAHLVGDPAIIDLGDQRMIERLPPPPRSFDRTSQFQ
jgi:hypothetical protein